MKRKLVMLITALTLVAVLIGTSVAMAAKPQQSGSGDDVIAKSNGFPSGPHFNLNIHGKDPSKFTCPDEDPLFEGWGNSIFIDIDGTTAIYYMTCKKSSVDVLTVLDGCGVFDGTVTIQLPKIPDGLPVEDQGYHAFARILAKPNNRQTPDDSEDIRSYIFLSPNAVSQICNDPQGSDEEGWYCDSELSLGLILKDDVYGDGGQEFYRFDDPQGQGRGKSKALDITRLFTYTGWVVDKRLDFGDSSGGSCNGTMADPDPDGIIDYCDLPADAWDIISDAGYDPNLYDKDPLWGNYNGYIDLIEEWLAYNADLDPPMAWYFQDAWILNIAEFVLTEGTIINDGTKLLQIRFYPRWTTEYVEPTP